MVSCCKMGIMHIPGIQMTAKIAKVFDVAVEDFLKWL